jgi:ABC-type polar amino acid transport system ATPase subunit
MRFAERLADLVLFLDGGRAGFFGPLKEFVASPEPQIQQFLILDDYRLPK